MRFLLITLPAADHHVIHEIAATFAQGNPMVEGIVIFWHWIPGHERHIAAAVPALEASKQIHFQ